jgi:hypothetical protein
MFPLVYFGIGIILSLIIVACTYFCDDKFDVTPRTLIILFMALTMWPFVMLTFLVLMTEDYAPLNKKLFTIGDDNG